MACVGEQGQAVGTQPRNGFHGDENKGDQQRAQQDLAGRLSMRMCVEMGHIVSS